MNDTSTTQRTATGVCVVRAEPQGKRLLITVTANPDIERRTPTRLSGHATDVATALELVVEFLREVSALNKNLSRHFDARLRDNSVTNR